MRNLYSWILMITLCNFLVPSICMAQSKLLFHSGFENGVYIDKDMLDIHGVDQTTGFDWDATPAWIDSTRFVYLVNRDKKLSDYMETQIVNKIGPHETKTRVLQFQSKADDPDRSSTSRSEYSLFCKKPPHNYQEGYCRYWMMLEKDLPKRIPFDEKSPWYMIMEWKEPDSGIQKSAEECKKLGGSKGGSNNYRININIRKDANSSDFYWQIIGQHPQPCRVTEWTYNNHDVKVPFGEWFMVEAYMKQAKTNGRVFFAVNGKVVLDTNQSKPDGFVGRTQHEDNPLPLRFWSIFKLYHDSAWYKHGPIKQWYDDVELWSGFPPNHYADQ